MKYSSQSKREFVREVKNSLSQTSETLYVAGALDCLIAYGIEIESSDVPISFAQFLDDHQSHIVEEYPEHADRIISYSAVLHDILSNNDIESGRSPDGLLTPFFRAKDTIGMWKDLGHLKKNEEMKQIVDTMTTLLHEDPQIAKNILESLVARLTIGELATKPMIGLVAVAAMTKGLPDWVSTDFGIQTLLLSTLALAVAKTEQDINNKLHNKPYLTVESNILTSILGFELRKSAYFVRLAWFVPTLIGPLFAYMQHGTDISAILLTQDLLYLGPMVVDMLLRFDAMDGIVKAGRNTVRNIKNLVY